MFPDTEPVDDEPTLADVPQLLVNGGDVDKAWLGDFEIVTATLTVTDVESGETGIIVLALSAELSMQFARSLGGLGATVRPLTKQVAAAEAAVNEESN